MTKHVRVFFVAFVAIAASAFFGRPTSADVLVQPTFSPLHSPVAVDSGWMTATSSEFQSLFEQEVRIPNAAWVRLRFVDTHLGGDIHAGNGAYLRITSLADGAVQTMNAIHLSQWNNRSAYFNGEGVRVELFGNNNSGPCRVGIEDVAFEIPTAPMPEEENGDEASPRSYCDLFDNRELSDDPRVARAVIDDTNSAPIVGTVFIIDDPNHTFLTSGPIADNLDADTVIEFNAPFTYPNGFTLNHPPPSDQYVVDLTSVQFASGAAGSGNNWGYFGAQANSTTGLTPFQTQGDYFVLADVIPPVDGRSLRTTGNGFTQPPIFRTWSYVQKSEIGQYVAFTGTRIQFRNDLTNGDSGTPVIDDSNDEVIGIASEDGCTTSGGSNAATAATNTNLRNALNHPLGVCIAIEFNYPNGLPELLNPNGGTTILVDVTGANGSQPQPGTGQLHYNANTGAGWVTLPMTQLTPNAYEAEFPALDCGAFVDYYFSVETTSGIRMPDQILNPVNTFRAISATTINVIADLNFEDITGWTVDNVTLTTGAWQNGVPVLSTANPPAPPAGAPSADFDGSGKCWLTGNVLSNGDVDGSATRLRSPTYNLAATSNAYISYAHWYTNAPDDGDALTVQISRNNGLAYSTLQTISNHTGWVISRHKLSDFGLVTSQMRFRFVAVDPTNNSRTEGAIDAFSIIDYVCDPGHSTECVKGDVDDNDIVDALDISGFTTVLLGGSGAGTQPFCATDMDNDGVLEATDDVASFVNCIVTGTCP